MKALSIRQPWAWLICKGYKDIENRDWHIHMPPLLNYPDTPKRIYVHTGKEQDCAYGFRKAFATLTKEHGDKAHQIWGQMWKSPSFTFGAIIGEVDITGCVEKSDSLWFVGKYGFTLANPVLYDKPIPCRGRLGFFIPDIRGADGE